MPHYMDHVSETRSYRAPLFMVNGIHDVFNKSPGTGFKVSLKSHCTIGQEKSGV